MKNASKRPKSYVLAENKFTGYTAKIFMRGELPTAKTLRKHERKSKASDCLSECRFWYCERGTDTKQDISLHDGRVFVG